jgi:hypothetical protein
VGSPPVIGILIIQDELPHVLDKALGALEHAKRPTVLHVVDDGEVAAGQGLVAALAAAGVVEGVVGCPPVVVAVLLARPWVGEDEDVGSLAGGADAVLAAAAVAVMQLAAADPHPRHQRPVRIRLRPFV